MVKREDKAFERFSLSRNGTSALPLSVYENSLGEITYTCYKRIMKAVGAFEKDNGDPFNADSIASLRAITDPFMKKYRYSLDSTELLYEYKASSALPTGTAETVILKTNDEIKKYPADTTLWNLEVDDCDDCDVICAVIENGRLAAYACVNDLDEDDGVEITVECAPASRRRGYASSCSIGLANYLLTSRKASAVYYRCHEGNEGSKKTAERAGFTYTGKSLTFVYVR